MCYAVSFSADNRRQLSPHLDINHQPTFSGQKRLLASGGGFQGTSLTARWERVLSPGLQPLLYSIVLQKRSDRESRPSYRNGSRATKQQQTHVDYHYKRGAFPSKAACLVYCEREVRHAVLCTTVPLKATKIGRADQCILCMYAFRVWCGTTSKIDSFEATAAIKSYQPNHVEVHVQSTCCVQIAPTCRLGLILFQKGIHRKNPTNGQMGGRWQQGDTTDL